jgi:hypothetical protein
MPSQTRTITLQSGDDQQSITEMLEARVYVAGTGIPVRMNAGERRIGATFLMRRICAAWSFSTEDCPPGRYAPQGSVRI